MPGIRFDDSAGAYVLLAAMALFFAVANGFILYRHLTWASRVRRLLEQEGFHVRQMERRWLTRGPFTDMRPPGLKLHQEWLVRVVAEDGERRPRAGWVRWRRRWPWEAADRWTVRWDEGPWSGQWGDAPAARKRGLSTAVFMTLVLPPALAGLPIGVYLLAQGIQDQQQGNELAPQQTAGASAPTSGVSTAAVYEIRCRGGRGAFRVEQLSAGPQTESGGQAGIVLLSLNFLAGPWAAGGVEGLIPGTCAWLDRPLNELEPRVIRFEAPAVRTPGPVLPVRGSFPDDDDLRNPTLYWSFFVFNTNQGYLQATSHKRWTPPEAPQGSGAQR